MRITAVEMLAWHDGVIQFWGIGDDGKTYLAMDTGKRDDEPGGLWAAQEVDPDLLERSMNGEVDILVIQWDSREAQWWGFRGWNNPYPADEYEMTPIERPFEHAPVEPDPDEDPEDQLTYMESMWDLPDFYRHMQMPEYQCVDGVDPLLKESGEASVCILAS